MRAYDLIKKKRDGKSLSREEIKFFIAGYCAGDIPDEQVAAFLMAAYFQGMNDAETFALTDAMVASGEIADLSEIEGIIVDKHSTGGVGDKTTLAVVPIVAACGIKVAKLSGRGLGHTGGTIDKLESIPGYTTALPRKTFINIVNTVGASIAGQSADLAPADKKLYALRDVTATVEVPALIASSIMSKKLASGANGILLDVKVGSGAFNKTYEQAELLAKKMVTIGKQAGRNTTALITDMDAPLGNAIGNSLELMEAIETLRGQGPKDFQELCIALATEMLYLGGIGEREACKPLAQEALSSGRAFAVLQRLVAAQGGDTACLTDFSRFKQPKFTAEFKAEQEGYIIRVDAEAYGSAALLLGAGRSRKEDSIDHSAGLVLHKKTGGYVRAGESIATLYSDRSDFSEPLAVLNNATEISVDPPQARELIWARID